MYVIICSTLITSHFLTLPESSKRTRRPLGVTISDMISMPKGSNLPSLLEARPAQPSFESKTIMSPTKVRHATSSSGKLVKNNADTVLIPSKLDRLGYTKASKTSAEKWLPDTFRLKSRLRELSTVQTTLDEVLHSELDSSRRQKRSAMNAYEKALNEESLSMVKKQPCGCCLQKYLYVNLPLKVTRKAIIDIRVKWTGNFAPPNIEILLLFKDFLQCYEVVDLHKSCLFPTVIYETGQMINLMTSDKLSSTNIHRWYDFSEYVFRYEEHACSCYF